MDNIIFPLIIDELIKSSTSQSYEFDFDIQKGVWTGNVLLKFADKTRKLYRICTARKKEKDWAHLEGCIKFVLDHSPEADIEFKFIQNGIAASFKRNNI